MLPFHVLDLDQIPSNVARACLVYNIYTYTYIYIYIYIDQTIKCCTFMSYIYRPNSLSQKPYGRLRFWYFLETFIEKGFNRKSVEITPGWVLSISISNECSWIPLAGQGEAPVFRDNHRHFNRKSVEMLMLPLAFFLQCQPDLI
jgi:hypothetical protein